MHDPSVYRVFSSRAQLAGNAVFELFAGELWGGERCGTAGRNNPGACYMRFEGLLPFARTMGRAAPQFRLTRNTQFSGTQVKTLLDTIELLAVKLRRVQSAADLLKALPDVRPDDAESKLVRANLLRSTEELAALAWRAWSRRSGLCVLSP